MMSNENAKKAEHRQAAERQAETGQAETGATETAAKGEAPETADSAAEAAAGEAARQSEAGGEDRVAALEAEVAELKERLLRALAECENVRRRAERERKEAADYGGTRLARDLLAVYDNLERALGHADAAARQHAGAVIDGIELTRRELLSAFAKHKIEMFTPEKGTRFDPHFQQAMFEAPIPGAQPGTVIEVMQAGFTIAGRLLRPALVGVAKAPDEKSEAATPEAETSGAETPEAETSATENQTARGGKGAG